MNANEALELSRKARAARESARVPAYLSACLLAIERTARMGSTTRIPLGDSMTTTYGQLTKDQGEELRSPYLAVFQPSLGQIQNIQLEEKRYVNN